MSANLQGPAGLVNQGWNQFNGLALSAFGQASAIVDGLTSFNIDPVNFNAQFSPPAALTQGFRAPTKPEDPELSFSIALPEPLDLDIPTLPNFGPAPEFDKDAPTLDFTGMPGRLDADKPPGSPELDDIVLPSAPNLQFPDLPTLTELNLPSPPEVIDVEFLGERPEFEGTVPDVTIAFDEEEYTSQCLDRLKVEIKRMLDDGTGMPPVVEQMLVDRARTREDREAQRAMQQATEDWSSRGFTLPSGVLASRMEEVRQNNQNQANTFSREVFIQRRQEEIQNFQFAISQGIALENLLINAHLNVQERAFRFAQAVAALAFDKLNAEVAIYNAAIQGYQADAAVYEAQIRAEAQKLERFRLEIQAEALKQEIDRNKVAIYTAQLESLQQVVNVYRAQLEGARTLAQVNEQRVRIYGSQIDAYRTQVEAHRTEWQTWATKVQGQLGKVQAYEAETRAFLADVQAYGTKVDALAQQPQIGIQIQDLKLRELTSRLETARTEIQAEGTRISSEAQVFGSKASMYAADGQIAANQSDANTRAFQAKVESRRTESERALASAQLNVEQVLRSAQLLSSSLDAAGRISAQLSAGAMSAVSLSAGISGSSSESFNYNF